MNYLFWFNCFLNANIGPAGMHLLRLVLSRAKRVQLKPYTPLIPEQHHASASAENEISLED